MDDQGISAWDVETAFDDGGRQQHVIPLFIESAHALFNLGRRHLAMRGDKFHFRYFGTQKFFNLGKVGNAGHDEKALPAAIMFAQERLTQHDWVPRHDICAHGEPVDWRRLNDGQFA